MTLGNLVDLMRSKAYGVEIRDKEGNTYCFTACNSKGIEPYLEYEITEWFPAGAPLTHGIEFTVYLDM